MIVISHHQVKSIIEAKCRQPFVNTSPDLGLSFVDVQLGDVVIFPNESPVSWSVVEEISEKKNNCFLLEDGKAWSIQEYSDIYNRVYTLYPTEIAPTMLVSGIPMHRIKDTNPWKDTQEKIKTFGSVGGHVLDTTTGLGYTAILAAESADQVTTIELDPAAQKIARLNPWSKRLFDNPKINLQIGDSAEIINTFRDGAFSGIIHDPPMLSMAGDLYSLAFYWEAFRVLKRGGRLFHYIGNPESKTGRNITRGVVERLRSVGFSRVIPSPNAYGVMAYKNRKMV